MKIHQLTQEQLLPIDLDQAWDFFSSPKNLDAITPDDLGFQITSKQVERMHEGQIITYRVKIAPLIWVNWVTEIKAVQQRVSFIDEQRFGPYAFWHHCHSFEEVEGGVKMTDLVNYGLPFGPFGAIAHALFVRRKLEWIFGERRRIGLGSLRSRHESWGMGHGLDVCQLALLAGPSVVVSPSLT